MDKVIRIAASDLNITGGLDPSKWEWITITLPDHSEVQAAKLLGDTVLEIQATLGTPTLKQGREYDVQFVFKFESDHKNIDEAHSQIADDEKRLIRLARDRQPGPICHQALGYITGTVDGQNIRIRGIDPYDQNCDREKYGLVVIGLELTEKPN